MASNERFPYYHLVPKEYAANLAFRKDTVKHGQANAKEIWVMCKRDPLFWINTFVWTLDPWLPHPKIPLITYGYQDAMVEEICAAMGFQWETQPHDLLIEKSRQQGATWLAVALNVHGWQFYELLTFLMISRKEEYVEKRGDYKALFSRADFILEAEPEFLRPPYSRRKLHLFNHEMKSTIDGESTTGEVGRGDRRTSILLDEFAAVEQGTHVLAATQAATACRIFNSTPKGTHNAFYAMRRSGIKVHRCHWSEHPDKGRGLYRFDDGRLKIIDEKYDFPEKYDFVVDGKLRSPWYDEEEKRSPSRLLMAQEQDIDYHGSESQFFDPGILSRCIEDHARPADAMGELLSGKFVEQRGGRLRLWCGLGADGKPLGDRSYVMGGDIAAGTSASNSCLAIADAKSGEKVAEFVSPTIMPHDLAKMAVELARWFRGAYMIWEANGHGRIFGNCVIELGYGNVYYRRREESRSKKTSDVPGWWSTRESKLALLGEYRLLLSDGRYINRSEDALKECSDYLFRPNGTVAHVSSTDDEDPSGANENHGDRVIADALCAKMLHERMPSVTDAPPEIPYMSLGWRRNQRQLAAAKTRGW